MTQIEFIKQEITQEMESLEKQMQNHVSAKNYAGALKCRCARDAFKRALDIVCNGQSFDEIDPQQLPKEVESQVWQIANNAAITFEQGFAILVAAKNAYEKGVKDGKTNIKNIS